MNKIINEISHGIREKKSQPKNESVDEFLSEIFLKLKINL